MQILEKAKRLPPIPIIYRIIHPSYSSCGICGLPWSNCNPHEIMVNEKSGYFAYCEYCNLHSTIAEKANAVNRLYVKWEKPPHSYSKHIESFIKDNL